MFLFSLPLTYFTCLVYSLNNSFYIFLKIYNFLKFNKDLAVDSAESLKLGASTDPNSSIFKFFSKFSRKYIYFYFGNFIVSFKP